MTFTPRLVALDIDGTLFAPEPGAGTVVESTTPRVHAAIQRAVDRGEIRREQVTERIARLPVDLFRYEILMTLRPLSDETIEDIVDTIFLPLLSPKTPPG